MTSELEEEIKRLPPGVAMLVSNEIERPITVNIRPRKSRHGGVSTQIVAREKAVAQRKTSGPETRPAASARKSGSEEKSGKGLLKRVFGARRA